jgi:putative ABC transport system permease protein
MLQTLTFIALRQWRVHKLRIALTILGIALGVAMYFAVRTANITLLGSLKVTVEKLAGKATLQVTAGESGFPEEILEVVRSTPGVQVAEPVIEVITHTGLKDEGNLLVVGIDTIGDQQLREYQFELSQTEIGDPLVYLAQPDSILISRSFAETHGLREEDKLPLYASAGRKEFVVRGIFKPIGIGEVFGGQIAIMDVYSAQFVFSRGRNFDRIDLTTDPSIKVETVQQRLRERLPAGLEVSPPASRGQSIENAVAALRQGLTLTSFVALLVGVFLILNSFAIAVNQRWREIGILRALGVEGHNVRLMFLGEAVIIGMIGSLLGVAGGFYLATAATRLMSSIAAITYGYISAPEAPVLRWDYLLESLILGFVVSLIAAWLPARAASQLNPVLALHDIEARQREAALSRKPTIIGVTMVAAGFALIRFSTPRVGAPTQYGYSVLLGLGLVILLPMLSQLGARALRPLMDRAFGSEGVLAVDAMIQAPRRTSATVGALMMGLGFVFSTGAFIKSEERLIGRWMDRAVNADFFVTGSELTRSPTYHFSEDFSRRIAAIPGVKTVENVRFVFVPYHGDNVAIRALELETWFAYMRDIIQEGDESKARNLAPKGQGVLVARNFSTRWGIGVGDRLRLESPTGPLEQPVLAIIEDYSSEKGTIFMDRALYKTYWRDSAVDFINIHINPGIDQAKFKAKLQEVTSGAQRAFIYTNEESKKWILGVVRQFFRFNYLQMLIAIFVAALGIINTLIISISERRREIGVIRAIGGLRRQIRKMVLLEAAAIGIIGLAAGALKSALDTYFLVRTVSTMIGGYTIPYLFPSALILLTIPLVTAIAIAAAWWPARQAVNSPVIEAIGYE